MRIGLLSDTHIPQAAEVLPSKITEAFQGVDLILHAGDIYLPSVLDELERIAPVVAARGDDDWGGTLTDKRVQAKQILKLNGRVIWLAHKRPDSLRSLWWIDSVRQKSPSSGQDITSIPDIVVYGHEHRTTIERNEDILFVNPGSPTFLGYRRGPGTIAILEISSDEAEAHIIQL